MINLFYVILITLAFCFSSVWGSTSSKEGKNFPLYKQPSQLYTDILETLQENSFVNIDNSVNINVLVLEKNQEKKEIKQSYSSLINVGRFNLFGRCCK